MMRFVIRDSSTDASVAELRTGPGAIIFGSGSVAGFVARACFAAGIPVTACCDSSPAKVGTECGGLPVIAPDEAIRKYPRANYIAGVLKATYLQEAVEKLAASDILSCYDARLVNRFLTPSSPEEADLLGCVDYHHSRFHPGSIKTSGVVLMVTEKCSLRCRGCLHLIPIIKDQRHYPFETIKKDIDAMCSCFDVIDDVAVNSGEPFLNPELHLIVRYAAEQPQVSTITVLSNGVAMPRPDHYRDLAHEKVRVRISNYGDLSRNIDKMTHELSARGIAYFIEEYDSGPWIAPPIPIADLGLSGESLAKHAGNCHLVGSSHDTPCMVVANQRLYKCVPMYMGLRAGFIPEHPSNQVDLSSVANADKLAALRRTVLHFMDYEKMLMGCNFCRGWNYDSERIPAAEQLEVGTP
jgi:hypothetical protein